MTKTCLSPFPLPEADSGEEFLAVVTSLLEQADDPADAHVGLGEIGALEALASYNGESLELAAALIYRLGHAPTRTQRTLIALPALCWLATFPQEAGISADDIAAGRLVPACPQRTVVATGFSTEHSALGTELSGRGRAWAGDAYDCLLAPVLLEDSRVEVHLIPRVDGVRVDVQGEHSWTPSYDVSLRGAPTSVSWLVEPDVAERVLSRQRLLHAAWCLGAANSAIERASEYSGEREQFGQPIGTFQSIRHQLAEAKVELTAGEALARTVATGDGSARASLLASVTAKRALLQASRTAQQVYGGFGYMTESNVHHPFLAAIDSTWRYGSLVDDEALLGAHIRSENYASAAPWR